MTRDAYEKLLRRYPELRPVPRGLQTAVLERARARSHARAGVAGLVLAIVAAIVSIPVLGGIVAMLVYLLSEALEPVLGEWSVLVLLAGFVAYFAALALVIVWMVETVDRAAVRRALRAELGMNRCVRCGYSLEGLRVEAGSSSVTCPECATRLVVANGVAMVDGPG